MRLSTKLFLFVGVLVLFICLAVYFVPAYLAKRAVTVSEKEYISLARERRERNWEVNNQWLSIQIGRLEGRIDSYLMLALGHPIRLFDDIFDPQDSWLVAAQTLATTSEVSFLQAVQGGKLSAGLTLSRARLFAAKLLPIEEEIGWVVLDAVPPWSADRRQVYMGIWVPSRMQAQTTASLKKAPRGANTIYLLFDPVELWKNPTRYDDLLKEKKEEIETLTLPGTSRAGEVAVEMVARLDRAAKHLKETYPTLEAMETYAKEIKAQPVKLPLDRLLGLTKETDQPEIHRSLYSGQVVRWPATSATTASLAGREALRLNLTRVIMRDDDIELVSALSFLAATGVVGDSPLDPRAPRGAARMLGGGSVGSGVVTRDLFTDKILYDPTPFLEKHPVVSEVLPLGSAFDLIYSEEIGALTVVNTATEVPTGSDTPGYLTLGGSLFETTMRVTHITGDTVILLFNGKVVDSIERGDFPEGPEVLKEIETKFSTLGEKTGFVNLGGTDYYYGAFQPRPQWNLHILTLEPAADALAELKQYEENSQALAKRITWRVLGVAIGLLIVALVILELIARQFTKPIRQLADAAAVIREGKFDEVVLPKVVEHSRNEVVQLTRAFHDMAAGLQEREKVRDVLNKVVSREIADEILSGHVHLGGEVKEATVFFADLRDFSVLTSHLPPEEVITFVNGYMTEMTHIIEAHQGVIDKYIGDAVMAIFGAPVEHPNSSFQAVLSGILIRDRLAEWNDERKAAGLLVAEIGIGIHTGPMVAGNMGAEDRLNYTVLGSNVTLAARLCDEADAAEILITENVLQNPHVADTIIVDKCPPVQPKGSAKPVQIYKVIGLKPGLVMEKLSEIAAQRRPEES